MDMSLDVFSPMDPAAPRKKRPTPTWRRAKRSVKAVKRTVEKPGREKTTTRALIKFGSDCSGYGTEVLAAEALGLRKRARFVFACEKDPVTRSILTYNTKHDRVDEDVTTRSLKEVGHVHNYTNGSPCTTFSTEGKQERLEFLFCRIMC